MEDVISKIDAIEEKFQAHKEERARYSTEVARVFKEKSTFLAMHGILSSNVATLENWKRGVALLEDKLKMLNDELPQPAMGDCNGLPCYEKDNVGDGLKCSF